MRVIHSFLIDNYIVIMAVVLIIGAVLWFQVYRNRKVMRMAAEHSVRNPGDCARCVMIHYARKNNVWYPRRWRAHGLCRGMNRAG